MEIAKPIFYFCQGSGSLISALSMLPTLIVAFLTFRKPYFALIVGYIAVGSGLMHLTDTPLTRVLDGSAMILLVSYLTLIQFGNWGKSKMIIFWIYNLLANIFLFVYPTVSLILFLINSIYLIYKYLISKKEKYFLKVSLAFFLLGFIFWIMDIARLNCSGHAVWHTLSALGIYFLYKFVYITSPNRF